MVLWCTSRKLVHTRVAWSGNDGFFGVQVGNLYIRELVVLSYMMVFWCTSRKLVHTIFVCSFVYDGFLVYKSETCTYDICLFFRIWCFFGVQVGNLYIRELFVLSYMMFFLVYKSETCTYESCLFFRIWCFFWCTSRKLVHTRVGW